MGLKRESAQVSPEFKKLLKQIQGNYMGVKQEAISERELTKRLAEIINLNDVSKQLIDADNLIKFDGRKR